MIDIAYCWDGETPEALLTVDGRELRGDPLEVQDVFDRLNRLRDALCSAREDAERSAHTAYQAAELAEAHAAVLRSIGEAPEWRGKNSSPEGTE